MRSEEGKEMSIWKVRVTKKTIEMLIAGKLYSK